MLWWIVAGVLGAGVLCVLYGTAIEHTWFRLSRYRLSRYRRDRFLSPRRPQRQNC